MQKRINLKWARPLNDEYYNFGDDLNPYLIEKLSGIKTSYIHFASSKVDVIKQYLLLLKKNFTSLKFHSYFIKSLFAKEYMIAIGSILNWYSSKRCTVWGAGIINRKYGIRNSNFLAVRGEYTKKRLGELGYNTNVALGDPGLLLPLVYHPEVEKKHEIGVIPHFTHYEKVKAAFPEDDRILIINLNNHNVEEVVRQFLSCKRFVSTSLHGLIIANSYGIDALWFEYKNKPLEKDNVKFLDYFSSVGIPEYVPFILDVDNFNIDAHIKLVDDNKKYASIQHDLNQIQQGLLKVAPFKVKEEFLK
ncbi:polysaccharide pyruvyl transferase family protein [Ochrovirga pacifica]|uniref:polysaccharide pyruvyl transferase family protein n=1 Tax=Ochrovirga pacifica TaxID=1042376 RepID=UPI0002559E00|nr:polysaccharide pyruvyl transferase family protein [Ochrovirga pacifica]